jgi:nucleotide-binding universal stress UspA family protein
MQSTAPSVLKNILVASDFSTISETALLYSLSIARRNNAKVWIVHVVGDTFFSSETQQRVVDDAWREGHRRMTEHFISGQLDGVENQLMVEQGNTWDVLSRIIGEKSIDLLVAGTRGRSRLGKLILGSVAESIFRQAPCPVLTVGPRSDPDFELKPNRKIIYCTGFSEHSLRAGDLALRLAENQGAQLVLLHVGPEDTPEPREQYVRDAHQKLKALVPKENRLKDPVTTLVEFGPASERILDVANEQQPSLIVLGVRQPEGFARRLRWATAYEVVNNAPCPVLTVRTIEP